MRDCVKNQQPIYQASFLRNEEIKDINGDATGSFKRVYKEKKLIYKNIISATFQTVGNVSVQIYGLLEKHSLLLVTSETLEYTLNDLFWLKSEECLKPQRIYTIGNVYHLLNVTIIGLNLLVGDNPYFYEEEDAEDEDL